MGRFHTHLQVEQVSPRHWRLTAPLIFASALLRRHITVPARFVTDFASVPRLPLAYWLAGNTAHRAAVVHDWLYSGREPTLCLTRRTADRVFLEAMHAEGVPLWRRRLIFRAVRLFGAAFYRPWPADAR